MTDKPPNRLYYGDCLVVMSQEMKPDSVDLIYLDPPFNSARNYNAIYKDETGRPLPDQVNAFCDTWTLDNETEAALQQIPTLMRDNGIDNDMADFWRLWMSAMRRINPALMSYLAYMTQRLLPMRTILKPTGSIYLHCDPTASHYIKAMMDTIFGHKNFINEIIWHYQTGGASKRWFSKKHDVILLYANGKDYVFNSDDVQVPRTEKSMKRAENPKGARIKADDKTKNAMDVWADIQALNPVAKERLGYATQKPVELLERIITASTNKGDVVFDPFCGCASTVEAAHKLGRHWIGIDIAIHAIKRVAAVRLRDRLGLLEERDFYIEGIPQSLEGAIDLWNRDKWHFQKWAVESVDGFVTSKRTGDGGIDGRLYFVKSDMDKDLSTMILEVKGGKSINISVLRDLRGTMERENAEMSGLIIMEPLGERQEKNFKSEMAQAGTLELNGVEYPRMQMLTIHEILEGKRFDTPSRVAGRGENQPSLLYGGNNNS